MKKLCVISGATSGMGREVAHELAKLNFDLVVMGRDKAKGDELEASIKALAPQCSFRYYVADMSDVQNAKTVSKEISKNHPVIDVLINNAGGVFSEFSLTKDGIE